MTEPDIEPKYYQNEVVKIELKTVRSYSKTVFEKFTIIGLLSSGEKVKLETLVVIFRESKRSNETQYVQNLAAVILNQSKGLISAIAKSLAHGNQQIAFELVLTITDAMWEKLLNLDKSQQFWEANFSTSLKRTALNCLKKTASISRNEISLHTTENSGNESDTLEYIPNHQSQKPLDNALISSALAELTLQERQVCILSVKERWTHEEIADQLKITDRTVRNILKRIAKKFEVWRDDASCE